MMPWVIGIVSVFICEFDVFIANGMGACEIREFNAVITCKCMINNKK
jgi:hypothetical protein